MNPSRWLTSAAVAASLSLSFARTGIAQEAGLEPLLRAIGSGRETVRGFHGASTMLRPESWAAFPAPDPKTAAWLAARIPGLDVKNVRVIDAATAEAAMGRAVDAKATYLDLFTDDTFRRTEVYYVPEAALNGIHRKFISGTLPIQGQAENGKPFQMQGVVAGQGRVDLLFGWDEFTFKEEGQRFKVSNHGRVGATIRAPGDVSIQGLSAYGAPIICPWAKIQRMAKESMYKMRVETSCGSRGGNDLSPIRRR